MRYDYLISKTEALRHMPLPGLEAHAKIFPLIAEQRVKALSKDPNPRLSSVAATFFPKNEEANLLLIERQTYKGVHSGQIAFPGGKKERIDANLNATALREMEEEIGIDRAIPRFVRSLSEVYIPPSGFLVHPFLYFLDELPPLRRQEREVKQILQIPLAHILEDKNLVIGSIQVNREFKMSTPYIQFENHKIWGATAMMISELRVLFKALD